MQDYRVVDCRSGTVVPEMVVRAATPEAAAREALGKDLMRGGRPRDLCARVYFQHERQGLTLVRLYTRTRDS